MNWIRQDKRLAIYLRDGLACCYCGATIEDGARLTLDHLIPYSRGGGNHESNLVTACLKCNSSRGARDWKQFSRATAIYLNHNVKAADIIRHISQVIIRRLDLGAAKELIARRGGFIAALNNAR